MDQAFHPARTPQAKDAPGLHHMQLMYGSFQDLVGKYEELGGHGMQPHRSANHGPMTSFYYRDPDGNNVEITAQNYPTLAAMVAFMASDAFKANPSGAEIDLFGRGFVLLQFDAQPDAAPLLEAADRQRVPLRREAVDDPDVARLHGGKLVLVRPDGHVAMRCDRLPDDAAAIIARVRGAGTARRVEGAAARPAMTAAVQ